jgi:hypothetical protein
MRFRRISAGPAPNYDFRPLPYLVSLGVIGAATVGIFFGAGFLLLWPACAFCRRDPWS